MGCSNWGTANILRELNVRHLSRTTLTPCLTHCLAMKCPSLHVAFRAMAAARVYGHRPTRGSSTPFNKLGGLSPPAESVAFQAEEYCWQEIVINLNDVGSVNRYRLCFKPAQHLSCMHPLKNLSAGSSNHDSLLEMRPHNKPGVF